MLVYDSKIEVVFPLQEKGAKWRLVGVVKVPVQFAGEMGLETMVGRKRSHRKPGKFAIEDHMVKPLIVKDTDSSEAQWRNDSPQASVAVEGSRRPEMRNTCAALYGCTESHRRARRWKRFKL